jgi:hypothetical protein
MNHRVVLRVLNRLLTLCLPKESLDRAGNDNCLKSVVAQGGIEPPTP